MTKQVQSRRGTDAEHSSFTGADGELSVNTTNKSIHVHDGVTLGGVEAARADLGNVSGNVILPSGVTLGTTAGVYSADNTLDDYEEGFWTPVFYGIGSGTMSQQFGTYTKIGRIIHIFGKVGWTGKTGTANLGITGLPFAVLHASDVWVRPCTRPEGDWEGINDLMDLNGMFRCHSSSLQGVIDNGSGSVSYMNASRVSTNGEFNFHLTYYTS